MAAAEGDLPLDQRLCFRIGINVGDVIVEGGDIYGEGVTIAARLQVLADPGGIAVSAAVRDQIVENSQSRSKIAAHIQVSRSRRMVQQRNLAIGASAPALAPTPRNSRVINSAFYRAPCVRAEASSVTPVKPERRRTNTSGSLADG
jgi:class 3 adenylate cyclase